MLSAAADRTYTRLRCRNIPLCRSLLRPIQVEWVWLVSDVTYIDLSAYGADPAVDIHSDADGSAVDIFICIRMRIQSTRCIEYT